MNRENMLRVADVIDTLPYAEPLWGQIGKPEAFCMATAFGTACCVGGWVCWIFEGMFGRMTPARTILELNQAQAEALFKPPGYELMKCDGRTGGKVLRLMAAAGDRVTGKRILSFWRNPWA